MFFKKYGVALCLFAICTFSQATNLTEPTTNKSNHNKPQIINKDSNAPFLKPGESVVITGDNNEHNYVVEMENLDRDSIFRKYSIIFVGGFLLLCIFGVIFTYFYITGRFKKEDGIIED